MIFRLLYTMGSISMLFRSPYLYGEYLNAIPSLFIHMGVFKRFSVPYTQAGYRNNLNLRIYPNFIS
jgi:hypothetical protein